MHAHAERTWSLQELTSQEYADERVPLEVAGVPLLEEDVCLHMYSASASAFVHRAWIPRKAQSAPRQ